MAGEKYGELAGALDAYNSSLRNLPGSPGLILGVNNDVHTVEGGGTLVDSADSVINGLNDDVQLRDLKLRCEGGVGGASNLVLSCSDRSAVRIFRANNTEVIGPETGSAWRFATDDCGGFRIEGIAPGKELTLDLKYVMPDGRELAGDKLKISTVDMPVIGGVDVMTNLVGIFNIKDSAGNVTDTYMAGKHVGTWLWPVMKLDETAVPANVLNMLLTNGLSIYAGDAICPLDVSAKTNNTFVTLFNKVHQAWVAGGSLGEEPTVDGVYQKVLTLFNIPSGKEQQYWLCNGGTYTLICWMSSPARVVALKITRVNVPNCQIAMDGNRDLKIIFGTTNDNHCTFWLNDNYDVIYYAGERNWGFKESPDGWEEDDDKTKCRRENIRDFEDNTIGRRKIIPGHGGPDNCKRDLEDFTVVQLKVPSVLTNLTGVTYWLQFTNIVRGSPKVNLFMAITNGVTGPFDYLTNSLVASNQALELKAFTIDGTTPQEITTNYINRYDQPIGFLLEGCTNGKGDLTFIVKKDNSEICRSSVLLDLQSITNFYDKFQIGKATVTNRFFGITWISEKPDKWEVQVETNARQVQVTTAYVPVSTQYLLFVNGWNVNAEQKKQEYDTAFKRLWWQGYKGGFGTFDWPTLFGVEDVPQLVFTKNRMNFDDSEMIAWLSATALSKLMQDLNTSGQLCVWAHSQGNPIMGEALMKYDISTHPKVKVYVASQAAIGGSFYSAQTEPQQVFTPKTPNIMAYWPCVTNIGAQPYFYSNATKVVSMCNYYNLYDYALHVGWERDNDWKPDKDAGWWFGYGGSTNYYEENTNAINRFYRAELTGYDEDRNPKFNYLGLDIITNADLRPRYEVFAYCAQSRLQALGQGTNSAFTGVNRNLFADSPHYDATHYSHSRQFRSNTADEWMYYYYLKKDCGF